MFLQTALWAGPFVMKEPARAVCLRIYLSSDLWKTLHYGSICSAFPPHTIQCSQAKQLKSVWWGAELESLSTGGRLKAWLTILKLLNTWCLYIRLCQDFCEHQMHMRNCLAQWRDIKSLRFNARIAEYFRSTLRFWILQSSWPWHYGK